MGNGNHRIISWSKIVRIRCRHIRRGKFEEEKGEVENEEEKKEVEKKLRRQGLEDVVCAGESLRAPFFLMYLCVCVRAFRNSYKGALWGCTIISEWPS